jgi:hypothetical protein
MIQTKKIDSSTRLIFFFYILNCPVYPTAYYITFFGTMMCRNNYRKRLGF